ncbi:MAG: IS1595 family transposase [Alphaproteobacteria bacterium]|nr:IS1595 family transposase [Alphaproteobacteria bacterium]
MKTKKPVIHQMTIAQFDAQFANEDDCAAYLVAHRWPKGVSCPRCGGNRVYKLESMKWKWECMECGKSTSYRFSHLVGTIFENTNMPLRTWFRVIHMMVTSKKGVSALQVHRVIGTGSYQTAWSMCHKIRAGFQDEQFQKLMGIVEVDETFVGGKARNRHKDKRGGGDGTGGIGSGKIPVGRAVQRKGNVIAKVLESTLMRPLTIRGASTL